MTNNQRKAAFVKLLHHYISNKDAKFLCSFISDLQNDKKLTKGEAVFLRAIISAALDHGDYFFLHHVIHRIKVRTWFFFERWESNRELRIRWIRSQIDQFNV